MKTVTTQPHNHKRAFALLLSIIISSVVLAIGISILKISVSQLQLAATGRESEIAFQASQSLTECLMFHRYDRESEFIARPGPRFGERNALPRDAKLNVPNIRCMLGVEASERYGEIVVNNRTGHIVKFHYLFDWGDDPQVCSEGDMYVMVPLEPEGLTHVFENTSVGEDGDGEKFCGFGNVCTIWITQGYNRSCDQLGTPLFTVQRELTTES